MEQLGRSFVSLNDAYYLWVPTMTVIEDGKTIAINQKWNNFLNETRTEITEHDFENNHELHAGVGEECYAHLSPASQREYTSKRIVFMKMKDRFYNTSVQDKIATV